MPIYEYVCQSCGNQFERLVLGGDPAPTCPSCRSEQLERLLSIPAVKSETTHDLAMRAARKRDRLQALDNMNEQRKYEESHDRHG